jgi:hypothetical protein
MYIDGQILNAQINGHSTASWSEVVDWSSHGSSNVDKQDTLETHHAK